jgi:hypothetical protein
MRMAKMGLNKSFTAIPRNICYYGLKDRFLNHLFFYFLDMNKGKISDMYDVAADIMNKARGTYKDKFISGLMEFTNPDIEWNYRKRVITMIYETIEENLGDMSKLGKHGANLADRLSELCARSGKTDTPEGHNEGYMCQLSSIELLMEFEAKFDTYLSEDKDYSLIELANTLVNLRPLSEAEKLADLKKKIEKRKHGIL